METTNTSYRYMWISQSAVTDKTKEQHLPKQAEIARLKELSGNTSEREPSLILKCTVLQIGNNDFIAVPHLGYFFPLGLNFQPLKFLPAVAG